MVIIISYNLAMRYNICSGSILQQRPTLSTSKMPFYACIYKIMFLRAGEVLSLLIFARYVQGSAPPPFCVGGAGLRDIIIQMATKTGYDCEFFDTISEDVETECSICLMILREPYIVQCCGNRFCRSCLEKIQSGGVALEDSPCPLCKQIIAAVMPDKRLERLLNEKRVHCSYQKSGCTWIGKLGQLELSHLNENPQPDKLMNGCMCVLVLCSQCQRVKVERREMKPHMEKECPKRIVLCIYCKEHRAAYEDISRTHHPVCPCIPVPCPKGCGAKPLRKNIKIHTTKLCPKNPQPCPFQIVGCTKKLIGHDEFESHLRDSAVLKSHLLSMERTITSLKKKNEEKDNQIRIDVTRKSDRRESTC